MATNRKAVSARMTDLFDDQMLMDSGDLIAGVDEAGRGPLAGAVYAAAVILDPNEPIEGLRDSKKLTEKERERLAVEIKEKAIAWSWDLPWNRSSSSWTAIAFRNSRTRRTPS